MGQAKLRGSQEDRMSQAKSRIDSLKPKIIICNNCANELIEITTMDTRGMSGIEAVFGAICGSCNHNTWAIKGSPSAAAELSLILEEQSGNISKFGSILK